MTAQRRAEQHLLAVGLIAVGSLFGVLSAQAQPEDASKPTAEFTKALRDYNKAWEDSTLAFTKVLFADDTITGFGQYTPRADAVYRDGETISVYAEPIGYAIAETDQGFEYSLTASYKLLNLSGQILAEQSAFAEFAGSSRSKQRELSASLAFQFTGLPAGDYALEAVFTDQIAGGSASFRLPFSIAAAAGE